MNTLVTVGDSPAHYQCLNLNPDHIAAWEDGLRTDPAARSFEWWYYDCRLVDGTRLTVELHTKPPVISPSAPLTPFVSIVMLRPDGSLIVKNALEPPETFAAARTGCDVRMGCSRCRGSLDQHEVHVEIEGVTIDLTFTSELAPFRPASGHTFFGENQDKYIAWLAVMPRAHVTAEITTEDRRELLSGIGYHDHNWGNAAPASLVDHWDWGHAHLGDFTVVTLHFVSHVKYGRQVVPAFFLGRSGQVLAQGVGGLQLTTRDEGIEPSTGVPVAAHLEYELAAGEARYRLDFTRRRDVLALGFGDAGGYLRFVGAASLARTAGLGPTESVRGEGLWEVLSFGPRQAGRLSPLR